MEQVISYINQFIALLGMRNLIIIGVILVLFIIAIVIYRSLRLKVCRSEIVDIENRINGIKTLPIQYRLGRVQSIAKNMKEVAAEYQEFAKDYDHIVDFLQNELNPLKDLAFLPFSAERKIYTEKVWEEIEIFLKL